MSRALITGISGFAGQHLATYLQSKNIEVVGTFLNTGINTECGIKVYKCDINDKQQVDYVLKDYKPDYIFHLAGPSFIADAWEREEDMFQTINYGTKILLQSASSYAHNSSLLYVSSADVYGDFCELNLPLTEITSPRPTNPYGYAKACTELLCLEYAKKFDLKIVIARPFNHTGPGQKEHFFCPSMAKQINSISKGFSKPRVSIGNLEVERDFLDVRDVVSAYFDLATKGNKGQIYNICSGKTIKLKHILDYMLVKLKLHEEVSIDIDPAKIRKDEKAKIVGNSEKISKEIGWAPVYEFESTLDSLLEYWGNNLARDSK